MLTVADAQPLALYFKQMDEASNPLAAKTFMSTQDSIIDFGVTSK
jgi:hypothetical protein